jgi:hypothetical protein
MARRQRQTTRWCDVTSLRHGDAATDQNLPQQFRLLNSKAPHEERTKLMGQAHATEAWLALLLRVIGGVCLLALVPLWMPRGWIDAGHRWLGWGPFPDSPIAEYLARSVSALTGFYGGLLVGLSTDVRRYAPLIRYQALAIMLLSASGLMVGSWAGMPLWFVGGNALACWLYCIPMLLLVRRIKSDPTS